MIEVPRGIFERSSNVFLLKVREVVEYLSMRRTGGQQIQDIDNTDALAPNAWPSAADFRINGDTIESTGHVPDPE
jgi:hypothetical protein